MSMRLVVADDAALFRRGLVQLGSPGGGVGAVGRTGIGGWTRRVFWTVMDSFQDGDYGGGRMAAPVSGSVSGCPGRTVRWRGVLGVVLSR